MVMSDEPLRVSGPAGDKERHMARQNGLGGWATSGIAVALAIGLAFAMTACSAPAATSTSGYRRDGPARHGRSPR
jgi:hypothetical protein